MYSQGKGLTDLQMMLHRFVFSVSIPLNLPLVSPEHRNVQICAPVDYPSYGFRVEALRGGIKMASPENEALPGRRVRGRAVYRELEWETSTSNSPRSLPLWTFSELALNNRDAGQSWGLVVPRSVGIYLHWYTRLAAWFFL